MEVVNMDNIHIYGHMTNTNHIDREHYKAKQSHRIISVWLSKLPLILAQS